MTKITLALIQMNPVPEDVEKNLRTAFTYMEKAAAVHPQVYVLPEMWSTDFLGVENKELARSSVYVLEKLGAYAKDHGAYIIGSIPELAEGKLYNTLYVVGPQGKPLAQYRKNHLFKPTGEHLVYTAGKDKVVLKTPLGKWGLGICFDLRFSDFIEELAKENIDILFIPAQWPAERLSHWEALLKARAIEKQIFVVGVNRVGSFKRIEYPGHSQVIDPWGDVVCRGSTHAEVITCTIDLDKVKEVREKIPMD